MSMEAFIKHLEACKAEREAAREAAEVWKRQCDEMVSLWEGLVEPLTSAGFLACRRRLVGATAWAPGFSYTAEGVDERGLAFGYFLPNETGPFVAVKSSRLAPMTACLQRNDDGSWSASVDGWDRPESFAPLDAVMAVRLIRATLDEPWEP